MAGRHRHARQTARGQTAVGHAAAGLQDAGRSAQAVSESSEPGQWRMESRTPYRTPEWLPDRRFAQRVGTSDAVGGELVPSDATLQLREGQLGVAL